MAKVFECPTKNNWMKEERKSAVGMILVSKKESLEDRTFAYIIGDLSRQVNELYLHLGHEADCSLDQNYC